MCASKILVPGFSSAVATDLRMPSLCWAFFASANRLRCLQTHGYVVEGAGMLMDGNSTVVVQRRTRGACLYVKYVVGNCAVSGVQLAKRGVNSWSDMETLVGERSAERSVCAQSI